MHNTLRDPLAVKLGQLLNQVVIFQKDGATESDWGVGGEGRGCRVEEGGTA